MSSIRKIELIVKHPGADHLDIVFVDGCPVITPAGLFKTGDLAIYHESGTPVTEEMALRLELLPRRLMRGCCYTSYTSYTSYPEIQTVDIRGVSSFGVLSPMSFLPRFLVPGADLSSVFTP